MKKEDGTLHISPIKKFEFTDYIVLKEAGKPDEYYKFSSSVMNMRILVSGQLSDGNFSITFPEKSKYKIPELSNRPTKPKYFYMKRYDIVSNQHIDIDVNYNLNQFNSNVNSEMCKDEVVERYTHNMIIPKDTIYNIVDTLPDELMTEYMMTELIID